MALPNFQNIFSDFGNNGLATSWREFLGYFVKQFWPGVNTQIDKLYFTRLDYPLLVMPFLLLAFMGLISFWRRPSLKTALAAALPAGLLAYAYFHTWAYWMVVVGILAAYTFIFRWPDEERRRGMIFLLGALGIVLAPYFWNYFQFINTPGHEDFMYRLWLLEGREVALLALGWPYLSYLALGVFAWLFYRRSDPDKAVFVVALILAMFAVWNLQLITGFVPTADHWKRIISPVLYIIIFWMGYDVVMRLGESQAGLKKTAAVLLIIFTLMAVTKKINNVYQLSTRVQPWILAKYKFPRELADSWEWVNKNLEAEPKIISSSAMTSQYLAVYTSARPYLAYGLLSPAPNAEVEKRFLTASRIFGVSDEILGAELGDEAKIPKECPEPECFDMEANFRKGPFNLFGCYFARGSFNQNLYRDCTVPQEYRKKLIGRYRGTLADWPSVEADYVYYGPHERQLSKIDFHSDPSLKLVYENPLVEIYQIGK